MRKDFVALILSHGRAENIKTYKTLRTSGYTGDIRIVIDDEDDQEDIYCRLYPGEVVKFCKREVACDTYDNRDERRVILFARNAAFDIAEKLGYEYFIELDDDYTNFATRFDKNGEFREKKISMLDIVFESMVSFLECVPECVTIAMGQGGDYIGGGKGTFGKKITMYRKAMNSFVCSVRRRIKFAGRINEDVNTYTTEGSRGKLFFTHNLICLNQLITQSNKGGMTGAYIDGGTYVKTFYSVISMPSAVKVSVMGMKNYRIHHKISWQNCVPRILRESAVCNEKN